MEIINFNWASSQNVLEQVAETQFGSTFRTPGISSKLESLRSQSGTSFSAALPTISTQNTFMKRLIIILLPAFLTIFSCNQKHLDYTIIIRLNGTKVVDKMYLFKEIGFAIDSAEFKNREYRFSGLFIEPQLCVISPTKNPGLGNVFILDQGKTVIRGDLTNFSKADISFDNKKNNELYVNFQNQFSNYENQLFNRIIPKMKSAEENNDSVKLKTYKDEMQLLAKDQRTKIFNFAEENPNFAGTAISISEVLLPKKYLKLDEFVKVYDLYSTRIKDSFYGLKLKDYIEDQISPPMKVGAQVIDFTMEDIEEKPISISDFRNKYVLIDFWASWCAPCRAENPNLKRAYDKYKTKGFEIVGISLDTDKEAWKIAIEKDELNWINLSDFKGWESELALKYKIKSVPSNMLLDKTGRIIAVEIRGAELQNKLELIFEK